MSTSPIYGCNCFAARRAARFITQIYERHLRAAGVTGPQFTILTAVRNRPGVDMMTLAAELGVDRTSLVRALKPMVRDGYMVDTPSQSDTRKMLITLSNAGQKKYLEAEPYWMAAQEEWNEKVGHERANNIRETLLGLTEI